MSHLGRDQARGPTSKWSQSLLTDLYQLTMMQAYFEKGFRGEAVFEMFMRRLPPTRNFLVAAGLEQAIEFLETARFKDEDLSYLESTKKFKPPFLKYLHDFRFTGSVNAISEGTVFFANEPLLQVVAPIIEAQYFETKLINIINAQTMLASKAARVVLSSPGKFLVEFGLRRAHGDESAMFAARASYIAGFHGTSNVAAGAKYGIPVYGTMAHSFVEAHLTEESAFEDFLSVYPQGTTLLIDTYDTEEGARRVVKLLKGLGSSYNLGAVRIDSGDLAEHAKRVRRILDEGGFKNVSIFASGNLDEYSLSALWANRAPIEGLGVGTQLTTSADAPSLDTVYKLQEYEGTPKKKLSENKVTWPGRKQVCRKLGPGDEWLGDLLCLEEEAVGLLKPVMRDGLPIAAKETLESIRKRCALEIGALPERLRLLAPQKPIEVEISAKLRALSEELDRSHARRSSC